MTDAGAKSLCRGEADRSWVIKQEELFFVGTQKESKKHHAVEIVTELEKGKVCY